MKKELIPIIAAYWGAKCSYEAVSIDGASRDIRILKAQLLYKISDPFLESQGGNNIFDFKLHLRPLNSITEEELRECLLKNGCKDLIDYFTFRIDEKRKSASRSGEVWLSITNNLLYMTSGLNHVSIINYLRSKGFCVDQEPIDNNLVKFIEP